VGGPLLATADADLDDSLEELHNSLEDDDSLEELLESRELHDSSKQDGGSEASTSINDIRTRTPTEMKGIGKPASFEQKTA